MPPENFGVPSQKASTARLRHARCLFHPLREAAAKCPHCGGTFCRECVTDEEGKLACPPCLRKMALPPAPRATRLRSIREVVAGLTALACVTALFFVLMRWRMNTPEEHLDLGNVANDLISGQGNE